MISKSSCLEQLELARQHATKVEEKTAAIQMELAESQTTVGTLTQQLLQAEGQVEACRLDARTKFVSLQSRWDALEQHTHDLEKAEAVLVAELQDARDKEDTAVLGSRHAEQQLERSRASEKAALQREQQASGQFRAQILSLQECLVRAEQDKEHVRARCFESEQLLHNSEESCARLNVKSEKC